MRALVISLVLATTSLNVVAQTNAPQVRQLLLEECIQIALEHNLNLQVQRMSPELSRYDLSSAYWAYDPVFSASGGHNFRRSPGGIDDTTKVEIPSSEQDGNFFSTSIQGTIPWGLRYGFGYDASDFYGLRGTRIGTNEFVRIPFENASAGLGFFGLRQSLLQGLTIDSARYNILVRKNALKVSELALLDQIMTTVNAVESAYYTLMFFQENVQVQRSALQLAERQLEEDRKRVEVGQKAPLDEKQAAAQAASRRADLLDAMGRLSTQQRVLKHLLSDNYDEWKDVVLEAREKLVAVPERLDLQESWRRGITQRPDLLQAKLRLERQGYEIKFTRNQTLPTLDVVGNAGWSGSSATGGDSFDNAMHQLGDRDNPYWSVSGEFSVPIFNRAAKNTYRSAKLAREQAALELKRLQQGILIKIEDDIAVVQTQFAKVHATREGRAFAEEALWAEEKKLASGKSTSFEVLALQDKLTTARSQEIGALTDYNIAVATLARDEGSTLERRRVNVETK